MLGKNTSEFYRGGPRPTVPDGSTLVDPNKTAVKKKKRKGAWSKPKERNR